MSHSVDKCLDLLLHFLNLCLHQPVFFSQLIFLFGKTGVSLKGQDCGFPHFCLDFSKFENLFLVLFFQTDHLESVFRLFSLKLGVSAHKPSHHFFLRLLSL